MQIAIKDIKLSPYQVRDLEGDPDLSALAESIDEHGQLQPIKVRPSEGHFECVFGHRRLKAAELAGLESIAAIVAETTDEEAQIQTLIENTQRKDLEPVEFGEACKALRKATGWSYSEIERRLGFAASVASRAAALLDEPEDIRAMTVADIGGRGASKTQSLFVTPTHIRETREALRDAESRADILRKAAKESLTVDQTRKLAERYRDAETSEAKKRVLEVPAKKQEALDIIHEDLREAKERVNRTRPAMTMLDYVSKVENAQSQIRKLLMAARELELWEVEGWPTAQRGFEGIARAITQFLEEVEQGEEL